MSQRHPTRQTYHPLNANPNLTAKKLTISQNTAPAQQTHPVAFPYVSLLLRILHLHVMVPSKTFSKRKAAKVANKSLTPRPPRVKRKPLATHSPKTKRTWPIKYPAFHLVPKKSTPVALSQLSSPHVGWEEQVGDVSSQRNALLLHMITTCRSSSRSKLKNLCTFIASHFL